MVWHFPRLPRTPNLFLGFWGWVFFGMFILAFYMCVVLLWAEYMMMYWLVKGLWLGACWVFFKTTGRRAHGA